MSPLLKPKFDPKLPIKPFRADTPITLILLAIFGAKNQMRYFFPVFNTVFAVASLCTRMYRMYTRERLQNVQHKVVQKKLIRCCILTKNLKETSKNVIRSWIHFESLNKGKIGLLNLFSLTSTSSSSISCIHYKWPPSVSNSTYSSTNRRIWTKAKKNRTLALFARMKIHGQKCGFFSTFVRLNGILFTNLPLWPRRHPLVSIILTSFIIKAEHTVPKSFFWTMSS